MQTGTDNTDSAASTLPAPLQPCDGEVPVPASPPTCAMDRWKAWDRFLEATPDTGFMQSSWWVEFRNYCRFENFALTFKDGNHFVGGGVVLKYLYSDDRCFYYIQDGPVLPRDPIAAEQVFQATLETIEERRKTEQHVVSHLRIEPRWQQLPGFVRGFRRVPEFTDKYCEPRNTLCIDLRASEEGILTQMKPKGRYNIGVARRHGVSIIEDTSAQGLADFLNIYHETATRQGIRAKPPYYFQKLISLLSSAHRGSLFFAEYQGARIATVLVVYFGARVTYFYGGSRDIYRHVMAPYILHFEVMRRAKEMGYEWYDLWGISPENKRDHPWQNLSVFKRKFGGVELKLVPTLDYVYDAASYAGCVAGQRDSGDNEFRGALSSEWNSTPENVNETCAK